MRTFRAISFLIAIVACQTGPGELGAQDPRAAPSAAEIVALLRTERSGALALEILTQRRGAEPRARLDSIADGLAETVIAYPGEDTAGIRTRSAARQTLLLAGIGERGTPYAGAGIRFLRIAESAESVGERGAALQGLTQLPNRNEALKFLRDVAVSSNPVAFVAVGLLAREMGPSGLGVVRELHRGELVIEPRARRELEGVAEYHGWK